MKKTKNIQTKPPGEHAEVVRTWTMIFSFFVAAFALGFSGWQTMLVRHSLAEQTIQTRLSRNAVIAQTWQGLQQEGNDLSRLFVDKPHLRPYFYDSKPVDGSDPNYNAVLAVCELYLDFFDAFQDDYVFELPDMDKNGKNRLLWEQYFKDMFSSSPALCSYAKGKESWYSNSTDFAEYMPKIKTLQQSISTNVSKSVVKP